jgi:hypothetical protein
LALLYLLNFVGNGLLLVLDLHNGVDRLCRVVNNAGTELCVRCRLYSDHEPDGECGKDWLFQRVVLSFAVDGCGCLAAKRHYYCAA